MTWAFYFGGLGIPELALVFLVAVVLFYKRLPSVGRGLGRGIIEFKKGIRDKSDSGDAEASKSGSESASGGRDRSGIAQEGPLR